MALLTFFLSFSIQKRLDRGSDLPGGAADQGRQREVPLLRIALPTPRQIPRACLLTENPARTDQGKPERFAVATT